MTPTPADLRAIPLFQDISDEHLSQLIGVLEHASLSSGETLFRAGDVPDRLILLVAGEVVLSENELIRFRLHPIAPIGELGSITGLARNTTAVTTQPSEIWTIATPRLMRFFEEHGDVAFPFYHNLLRIVADKTRRDGRRMYEMRANIIRTQKAMKRMRDLVLESEDTVLSRPVFETLEDLIEHNRRWRYMVEPAHTLGASVRLDDGTLVEVREMSSMVVRIGSWAGAPAPGSYWSGVLVVPGAEIPICGTVESSNADGVAVQLDMLIAAYAAQYDEYLTRLHMLDFVL
jgi:CRP-like cAMP-binding protein